MILVKPDSVPPVLLHYTDDVHFLIRSVDEALHDFGLHAFITSGMEGVHTRASKHFKSQAVDFRLVWALERRDLVLQAIKNKFGTRAKYILEPDHLHTETL